MEDTAPGRGLLGTGGGQIQCARLRPLRAGPSPGPVIADPLTQPCALQDQQFRGCGLGVAPLVSPHLPGFQGWQAARSLIQPRLTTLRRLPAPAVQWLAVGPTRCEAGGCVPRPASPCAPAGVPPGGAPGRQSCQRRRARPRSGPWRCSANASQNLLAPRPGFRQPFGGQRAENRCGFAAQLLASSSKWAGPGPHLQNYQLARIGCQRFQHRLPSLSPLSMRGGPAPGRSCCKRAGQAVQHVRPSGL